jgi:hypothetical protein
MKRPLAMLFALIGIKRPKPKTRMGRILRNGERVLFVLAFLYIALITYPNMLFAGQVSHGTIRLHMRNARIPDSATSIIDRAETLLKACEFWDPSLRHDVFSCDGFSLFAFLCPRSRHSYAVANLGNVFLAKADFDRDVGFRNAPTENTRALHTIIAHELTHNLLRVQLGFWRYRLLPTWKNEGYCEVISRGRSDGLQDDILKMAATTNRRSKAYVYGKYRLLVAYLMQIKGLNFNDIVALDDSQQEVETEMRHWATNTDMSSNHVPEDTARKLADPQH